MNRSEDIKELIIAMSKLQGELGVVSKSSEGYGYNYADLASVFNLVLPLLSKYELFISQPVNGDGAITTITTILFHSSGQYIGDEYRVPVDTTNKKMNSLQSAGSTITYLRRYCVMSLLGLAAADDDGHASDVKRANLKERIMECIINGQLTQQNMQKALSHYRVKGIDNLSIDQMEAVLSRAPKVKMLEEVNE